MEEEPRLQARDSSASSRREWDISSQIPKEDERDVERLERLVAGRAGEAR
jgi:hypothetical protein